LATAPAAIGDKPSYPIGSVDSALRLLLMIGEKQRVRIADASKELGVARSTAHRLMQMLQYHGLVRQDPESKAYTAGPVLISLGLQIVGNLDVRSIARPFVEALVEEAQETVHLLALQQNGEMLCLDSVESPRAVRVGERTGMVMPAFASASGRAILAMLPPERVQELYPGARLPRLHANTVSTRAKLFEELEETRARGFAVQRSETETDVSAVAAPVPDRRGQPSFALTIAVPSSRLEDADIPRLGAAVIRAAEQVGAALPF
jgi:DNA-binding IclR family transcriptional regulator